MASFPDLRPRACSATAECGAALLFGPLARLLTVRAVLPYNAFVAVSELATLRGNKALSTPVSPTKASCFGVASFVGTRECETRPA
jgi:hypothetical protein